MTHLSIYRRVMDLTRKQAGEAYGRSKGAIAKWEEEDDTFTFAKSCYHDQIKAVALPLIAAWKDQSLTPQEDLRISRAILLRSAEEIAKGYAFTGKLGRSFGAAAILRWETGPHPKTSLVAEYKADMRERATAKLLRLGL